jgi:hypothetical protein
MAVSAVAGYRNSTQDWDGGNPGPQVALLLGLVISWPRYRRNSLGALR